VRLLSHCNATRKYFLAAKSNLLDAHEQEIATGRRADQANYGLAVYAPTMLRSYSCSTIGWPQLKNVVASWPRRRLLLLTL
jgi:hypothetical protein